ncbi:MAG: hypothetical protein ACI39W_06065 [Brotaphodocola sp.]
MNEKVASLAKLQKYMQFTIISMVVMTVIAFMFALKVRQIAIPFVIFLAAIYLFVFRGLVRKYRQGVKTATMEESFRPFFKDIVYEKKDNSYQKEIIDAHFLPVENKKNILIRDILHGTYQAKPACIMDATTDYIKDNAASYLSGCYFSLRLRKTFTGSCMLWSKKCLDSNSMKRYFSEFQQIDAPNGLAKDFILFTPKNTNEMPKLPNEFITELLRLYEYTPGEIAVQITGDMLRIFIRNRFLFLRKIEINYAVSAQMLKENPFPEMPYLLRVADALQG